MDSAQPTSYEQDPQASATDVDSLFDTIDEAPVIRRLQQYRLTGRKGYPLVALWRAYVASFALNLPHTNALIRRLRNDRALREACGFDKLPHRTTFGRFIKRLANHQDLVEDSLRGVTDLIKADGRLEGFGERVAVDSTVVRAFSNPKRRRVSDPDASWTRKPSSRAKDPDGKEWIFGFKYHLLVDAVYGVPIIGFTTTASRNDSPELPRLLDKAETSFGWFKPAAVICDKGYDAQSNYVDVVARGAAPVIAIRKLPNDELREGIYTDQGVPTCVGMAEMDYIGTRPGQGHLYRCPPQGCRLKARKGVRYCHDTEWVNRPDDPKVFGPIRRASNLWKALYRLRQTVEGVFKTLKESRRLERHCTRGLKAIGLHATMAVLVFQATFALRLARNQMGLLRWMVDPIA